MKHINIIKGGLALLMAGSLTGCLKKVDTINSDTTTITFNNSGTKFLTGDETISPKDSIYIDFTVTCPTDMRFVSIQKNGADIIRDTLTSATARKYSAVKKLKSDSIPGTYTYTVVAKDADGTFLGSSGFAVTVAPDFDYYVDRRLYVPDTAAKTNKCYYAAAGGQTFSYSDGAGNSSKIDFGYFYDTTSTGTPPKHTIYALNASTFAPYDLSAWTKNATLFKRITTPAFSAITSAAELQKQGVANLTSGGLSKVSCATGVTTAGKLTGNVYMFKTAAGKYGVINVLYTNADSPLPTTFMTIDVKIQR